jgi:hypothetical protein
VGNQASRPAPWSGNLWTLGQAWSSWIDRDPLDRQPLDTWTGLELLDRQGSLGQATPGHFDRLGALG